ncbi:MAG: malate/lactate/ureidoglycolate dehydrogenase [Candidatus Eremiobacteraeota bacterium]|nr:malate/lactate/ureidoglycolate dehydrogenase [Candidatus Eremiobacteraeota bacterium]MBV8282706.1 malate/lactate/ureidoglycolate dehydrogenase [Candidatus Eremiobacteraeota bacterium]
MTTAATEIRVDHERLRAVARTIVRATGSDEAEAAEVADHLVEANLKGHDSHGVGMLPIYVENFQAGHLHPNRSAKLIREDGAIAVFSGEMGYGQKVAREVMDWAIERAREGGVAIAALRDVQHIARVGAYGEHAAFAGMISVIFVNAVSGMPFVAPFRGADGRYGTNPICIAIPTSDPQTPIVLDFATSVVAMGKVRVAYNSGKPMPPGMLIDQQGAPTQDPGVLWPDRTRGAILPFGAHKGYGLAVVAELLGGALTGGGTYQPENERDCGIKNGMLAIVIDPARLGDVGAFAHEIDAFVDYVKASPPAKSDEPVLVAGDPERLMRAERIARGIPIDPKTWSDIRAAADALGVGHVVHIVLR